MLARIPWIPIERTAAKPKPKAKRRLNQDRRDHLLATTINVLRHGEPTPFAMEGDCRHGLRALFCRDGWTWTAADDAAAWIVETALARIGATRPTWGEGQPDHCQPGVLALARTRCVQCGWKLPEGHYKFCSRPCHVGFYADRARADRGAALNARIYAHYDAWSAKQPEQPCELCERMFRPKRPGRRFCSKICANRRNNGLVREWRIL